jgi:hypothetical protein
MGQLIHSPSVRTDMKPSNDQRSAQNDKKRLKIFPILMMVGGAWITLIVSAALLATYQSGQRQQAAIAAANQQREQAAPANPAKNVKDPAYYKAFQDKAIGVTKLKPELSPIEHPKIKGKVLVFERMRDTFPYEMIGFQVRSNEQLQQYVGNDESAIKNYNLTFNDLAENLAELETVIQVDCDSTDEVVAHYEGGFDAYASYCLVSMIDYKTKTIVAQETFENRTADDSVRIAKGEVAVFLPVPLTPVRDYLKQFPRT